MNNDGIIAVCAIAIAIVSICAAVYFSTNNNVSSSDGDLVGQWYAVDVEGYDVDGNNTNLSITDSDIVLFDLSIYTNSYNTLNGYTLGKGSMASGAEGISSVRRGPE